MPLGVCTGPLRGKPLNGWEEVEFPASRVFCPNYHQYFVVNKDDGYLYAFGNNNGGMLGVGLKHTAYGTGNAWIKRPLKTDLQNVVKVVGAAEFVIALTSSGELYVAGKNTNGILGLGYASDQQETFTRIDLNTYIDVSAGIRRGLAIRNDGALFGWGDNQGSSRGTFTDSAVDYVTSPMQLAQRLADPVTGVMTYKTDWAQVYCVNNASIAIDSSGVAYGRGTAGIFCDGDPSFTDLNTDFTIRCGYTEGTFDPGHNTGIGTAAGKFYINDIAASWKRAAATWTQLTCGTNSALGYSGGTLYGWGSDASGLFGMGDQQITGWNSTLGVYLQYRNRVGALVSNAVDPSTGDPNTPFIEPYYANSANRWSLTEPAIWDQTTKPDTDYLGSYEWFEKSPLGSTSPYTIPITLGTHTATNTIIPTGTIKCSGWTTFFLTGKRLYACGNLSFFNTNNSSVPNATDNILLRELSGLQGNIDEFDVARHTNSGIFRSGNDVYVFGELGYLYGLPVGGLSANDPVKYIIKNADPSFNPIKPIAP